MSAWYPDEATLRVVLRGVAADSFGHRPVIVDREPIRSGTFPKEIVTLQSGNGERPRVLIKYAAGGDHDDHGHRAGVAYESLIYRDLLKPLGIDRPVFLGTYTEDGPGHEWLILEFMEGARRLTKSRVEGVLERAAEWSARFHAACEASVADNPAIRRYDEAYYLGWVARARDAGGAFPSLRGSMEDAWRYAEEMIRNYLCDPDTIAHSEYYPNNILVVDGEIHPVDWESAAIAPGELDLASMTDGWPPDVVGRCVAAYREVRWGGDPPDVHERRLEAARAYLHCRWLAREADKGRLSESNPRFRRLRELADGGKFDPRVGGGRP